MKRSGGGGEERAEEDLLVSLDIKEHIRWIQKGVETGEPRFLLRALRVLPRLRRQLTASYLSSFLKSFPPGDPVPSFIQVDKACKPGPPLLPEVDAYLHLLLLLHLLDTQNLSKAVACADLLVAKLAAQNRRSLQHLAARAYFYFSRSYELTNQLAKIRPILFARLRTVTLQNDLEGQAVLINCLLRSYLAYNLYEPADKLVRNTVFPETASGQEWARFLYYRGRISAARMEYEEAHKYLVEAVMKGTAIGFQQTAYKLLVTVRLLLGEIPERALFREPPLRRSLAPYLQITRAVRAGDLDHFEGVLSKHGPQLDRDHTGSLIARLRYNVLKAAVRAIGLSYSRICADKVAEKLRLESTEEAECILMKAIREGVVEGKLDTAQNCLVSRPPAPLYVTREPQLAYHRRISFCLGLYNLSVRAMRYPAWSCSRTESLTPLSEDLHYHLFLEDDDSFS